MSIKNSTIFTTKNKELAIFGQTLSDVKKKPLDFNDVWMQGGRYGSNKAQIIPEENLIKVLSIDEAKQQLQSLNQPVNSGKMTYEEYFNTIGKSNTVLRTYVTTTDQQSQSTQGLVKASQEARAAQITQNEAIQASTLSAKAATVATKAFAIAGNMIAMWAISQVISIVVENIDDLIHSAQNTSEAMDELASESRSRLDELQDEADTIKDLISKYEELANSETYDSSTHSEIKDIQEQITELVGTQANNLDLVNGKLDEELEKLRKIASEEASETLDQAVANYINIEKRKSKNQNKDFLFLCI